LYARAASAIDRFVACCPSDVYNTGMASKIPPEIGGQRYISMATFRKNGTPVYTPLWFGEDSEHLYVMTNSKSGKVKRLRNNPDVRIAPSTIRGKVTGSEFSARVRFLKPDEFPYAQQLIKAKYWLARVPFLWRNTDTYLEITPGPA
jgi:PPOX class probable F420-dependent enzyme